MNLGALIGIPPATVRSVTHVVPNELRGAKFRSWCQSSSLSTATFQYASHLN